MNPVRQTHIKFFKLLGFRGARDWVASAFGVKAYPLPLLKLQLSGTALAAVLAFCTKWVWNPPLALVLLVVLDLGNAWYGYRVAVQLRGGHFRADELQRTFGKVVGTLLVLTTIKNLINSYDYYAYAADVVFAWLFTYKFRKMVLKMVALKVAEGGLPKLILGLLQSKVGTDLVDAMQRKEPAKAAVPKPAAAPTIVSDTPVNAPEYW